MPTQAESFSEYEVAGVGTVIGHVDGYYHVRTSDGRVVGYPASGAPEQSKAASDIASAIANPPPPPPPYEVTPLQMRRALNLAGLRDAVEASILASSRETKDAWEFASVIRRDNALLGGMASALGMSEKDVDDLFRLAAAQA